MPVCHIQTNASLSDADLRNASEATAQQVSSQLGKSIDYVMTRIDANLEMSFGGTREPCAYGELASLGLDAEQIPALSRALTDSIASILGVAPDRIYLRFESPPRTHFAFNGNPFG